MGSETASRLDVDFPVLVPEWVPEPFDTAPAVNTWSGHYGLYWVVTGGAPTFLEITGDTGGDIPDFSWYDRNVELTVNAEVAGAPAYRDLTPIYDNVYWEVEDVVYTVSSQGMVGMTSLDLANALIRLESPTPDPSVEAPSVSVAETVVSGEMVDIAVRAGGGATLSADLGTFPLTGGATVEGVRNESIRWLAPDVQNERAVTFTLSDPNTGEWLAAASTVILAPSSPARPLALECPVSVTGGGTITFTASGGGDVVIEAATGTFPATGGNLAFDGAGTARLVGTLSTSGSTSFTWLAPETTDAGGATLYLSGMSGASGDTCTVQVSEPGSGSSPDTTATREASQGNPSATSPAGQNPAVTAMPTDGTTTSPGRTTATRTASGSVEATVQAGTSGDGTAGGARSTGVSRDNPADDAAPTPTRGRIRYPSSDGTGGVSYPRYDGVDPALAVGGMTDAPAPTNAPMPDAPASLTPSEAASGIAVGSSASASGAGWLALGLLLVGLVAIGLIATAVARDTRR